MQQRTKAESDAAVAAASILAREKFIDWMDEKGEMLGIPLPRGASEQVIDAGRKLVKKMGAGGLDAVAKVHFRTTDSIL